MTKGAIGALLAIVIPCLAVESGKLLFREDFQSGLRPLWQKVQFTRETEYRIVEEGTNSVLQSTARSAASGYAAKLDAISAKGALLSWKWKIDHVPPGGSDNDLKTFDHTARLFVAFKTFVGPPRTINYVWANHAPVGSTFHHPSSGRSRFIVLQSGNDKAAQWMTQTRNITKDWKLLFGDEEPPAIVGLGFMTDADGTKSTVTGWYDDIELR